MPVLVAAVVTVDEPGERPRWLGVYPLGAGTAQGQGAVIGSTQAASASMRLRAVAEPLRRDLASKAPTVPSTRMRRANRAEHDELGRATARGIPPRVLDEPIARPPTPGTDRLTPLNDITREINEDTRRTPT